MIKKAQLPLQTTNMLVGFMCWVLLSSLIPFISQDIDIPITQLGIVTAIPVLVGSALRIPYGYLTNLIGARPVYLMTFLILLFPLVYISFATSVTDLIIGGIFLGAGGAVFSVGVTSLPKYYPKERHGFVNGVFGLGNAGTALATFGAPVLASQFGWQNGIRLIIIVVLIYLALNFFLGDKNEPTVKQPLVDQIKAVSKNIIMWLMTYWYFITFGVFVAFTVFLPNHLVTNYNIEPVDAGLRAAGFIVLATLMRPVGGYIGDRLNPLKGMIVSFGGIVITSAIIAFDPNITIFTIAVLSLAITAGIGNGLIFKLMPMYFTKLAGIANGIVAMAGGLGGFFPPIILSQVFAATGHYTIGFLLLTFVSLTCLISIPWLFKYNREHNINYR